VYQLKTKSSSTEKREQSFSEAKRASQFGS
jgi:hypothetical protein